MEEQKEITITRDIAEIFNKNGMDSRHAQSIIWDVLPSVYRLLKKKHGISKDEIASLMIIREALKEIPFDVDEKLKKLLRYGM